MSKREDIEVRSEKLILPLIDSFGFELVDIEFVKEAGAYYLRAYIDKPGGINIEDCENVSRRFSDLLDEEDFIEESYILEVSSPGLGRPLKKEKDFVRSIGEDIEIRLFAPLNGRKEYEGTLTEYSDGIITIVTENDEILKIDKADTALVRLALDF